MKKKKACDSTWCIQTRMSSSTSHTVCSKPYSGRESQRSYPHTRAYDVLLTNTNTKADNLTAMVSENSGQQRLRRVTINLVSLVDLAINSGQWRRYATMMTSVECSDSTRQNTTGMRHATDQWTPIKSFSFMYHIHFAWFSNMASSTYFNLCLYFRDTSMLVTPSHHNIQQ